MTLENLINDFDSDTVGIEIYSLIRNLYPICRSITGNGIRETFKILQDHIPIKTHEMPSGTKVFDWTIPKEWNIKDAYVKNSKGERIIDFRKSNLHVLNYSIPIHKTMTLKELNDHLYTLPEYPDWIPYKTSYYKENWGFCLSHNNLIKLKDDKYEVFINSTLEDGFLTYSDFYIKGEQEEEVLISCHACHPSLANDNLSGVCLSTMLAKYLSTVSLRYSYRFVFIPGTIGAIAWLCHNEILVNRIRHGLVISGVGDAGIISYKQSRHGNSEIDRAAEKVLKDSGQKHQIFKFDPYGYDERQYCSPGFNLPVGRLSKTPYGEYPEYHTSADNLDFVKPKFLNDSFQTILRILYVLEKNRTYLNLNPKCEPQLGKRGLYDSIGDHEIAMLWVLNRSDGENSLLDISERSGIEFNKIYGAASLLSKAGLLKALKKTSA